MKNLWIIIVVLAVGTIAAQAQADSLVEISNESGEGRKICIHSPEKITLISKECFKLKRDEKVTWNREGDRSRFKVKVYKLAFIDKFLYSRDLEGETQRITMGEGGRFGYSLFEAKPKTLKYILKACNQFSAETVYFALAHETNEGRLTEGWWNLEKGKCLEFPVSEHLKNNIGIDYGNVPRTYYYARTHGENALQWHGGDEGRKICVNESKVFKLKSRVLHDGNFDPTCDERGFSTVSFRRVNDPKTNEVYYYLNF